MSILFLAHDNRLKASRTVTKRPTKVSKETYEAARQQDQSEPHSQTFVNNLNDKTVTNDNNATLLTLLGLVWHKNRSLWATLYHERQ
jgi:hypothetical protein